MFGDAPGRAAAVSGPCGRPAVVAVTAAGAVPGTAVAVAGVRVSGATPLCASAGTAIPLGRAGTRRQGGMMIKQPGDRGCARKGCGGVGSLRAARRCRSHGRGGCAWHSRGGSRAWCASERNHARLCFGRNRDGGRPRRVWRQGGRMIQRPGIGGCTRNGCGGVGSLRAASRCQSDGRGGCSWYSRGGGWNRNGGRPCPAGKVVG